MSDKKISQLPNLDRVNYTSSDLLLINNGLAPYVSQTTSNTLVFDFLKYFTGTTNYITGVTFSLGVLTLYLNGTLQTIPVTGLTSTYLTGGTYSKALSAMTFTNNTGGTFNVTGMYFPKIPRGVNNSVQYNNNQTYFSGNTLIYNSGTTSIYNRGHNGIIGNTFFGEDAGGKTTKSGQTVFGAFSYSGLSSSGNYNQLFGSYTLSSSTTANQNEFFGYGISKNGTTVQKSTLFGSNNGTTSLTTESNTTSVGYNNYSNSSATGDASDGVAIGSLSSFQILEVGAPTSIGYGARYVGASSDNGTYVVIGSNAEYNGGYFSNGFTDTVTIGANSLKSLVYPGNSSGGVVIGSNTLTGATSIYYSTAVGNNLHQSLNFQYSNMTALGDGTNSFKVGYGTNNTPVVFAMGTYIYSSNSNIGGSNGNSIIGYKTGSGHASSLFIGSNVMSQTKNPNAANCIYLGSYISPLNVSVHGGSEGTYSASILGSQIYPNKPNGNLTYGNYIIGNYVGNTDTTSNDINLNFAVGNQCLYNNTASSIISFGNRNSFSSITATFNSSIGNDGLYNSNNSYTTSIGYKSGYSLTGNTNTSNTFIGAYAGSNLKGGSNNTIIGYSGQASSTIVSNEITLGNSSITSLRCNVTSITSLSDLRDKKDINSISLGLNIINELNPVTFTWDTRDKSKVGLKSSGFIAQQVLEIEKKYNLTNNFKLVYESNPEKLEISSWNILPIMVKSLQELSKKNKELKERIKKLTI
jgi:hypothetical protein